MLRLGLHYLSSATFPSAGLSLSPELELEEQMSPTTSAGLLVIGFGLITILMDRLFIGFLVRSYAARHSDPDSRRYERRQKIYFRTLAGFFLLCGLIMFTYGLAGGNLRGL